jgi:acyl carrier protein
MDDVEKRVTRCLGQVLALEPETLKSADRLMEDLGADSLDLVELMYLLEDEFEVHLERSDVNLSAQLGLPEEAIHRDEVLTAEALQVLRERYPSAHQFLVPGIQRKHLAALLTIGEIARAMRAKLASAGRPEREPRRPLGPGR